MMKQLLMGMLSGPVSSQQPKRSHPASGQDGLEELCGLVRGFARTAFVTSQSLGSIASLLEALRSSATSPSDFEDAVARHFGQGGQRGLDALDELIRSLEDERWDSGLAATVSPGLDWRSARCEVVDRLRAVRERLTGDRIASRPAVRVSVTGIAVRKLEA